MENVVLENRFPMMLKRFNALFWVTVIPFLIPDAGLRDRGNFYILGYQGETIVGQCGKLVGNGKWENTGA